MMLDRILKQTKKRVEQLPADFPEPDARAPLSLAEAIRACGGKNAIIAEIKCASPSRGIIRRNVDAAVMAGELREGGCTAISVLTEPYFFGGTLRDLGKVRRSVNLPVLRKDFIIDTRQIDESRSAGADAVLLIAAVLGRGLPLFVEYAIGSGLEPLVEVHNEKEAADAAATEATMIGINNRDLGTLQIDRSTTRVLSEQIRGEGKMIVSESGMRSADDVRELRPYCDAFLIGSAIMSHRHPREKLEEFVCA